MMWLKPPSQAYAWLGVSKLQVPAAMPATGADSASAAAETASAERMARVTGATWGRAWARSLRRRALLADAFITSPDYCWLYVDSAHGMAKAAPPRGRFMPNVRLS